MLAMKVVLSATKRKLHENLLINGHKYQHVTTVSIIVRKLSTKEITKNISIISSEDRKVKVDHLKLNPPQERPLVIMPTWLMAKKKHINKYAKIYVDQGFDVMNISITPWQLLWPVKGTQVVARDILKFLDINKTYEPLLLHGFSVGGYLWGEVMVQMAAEKTKYEPLMNKIVGQVWDSAADITEISIGVPIAVFPNNQVMQTALRSYMIYHLKTFDKVATCHYVRASQLFHTNLIRAPALILCSKSDPIGAERSNQRARESWESNGITVRFKCWDKSPHVGHMAMHPEEYLAEVYNLLEKLSLMSVQEKVKVKL